MHSSQEYGDISSLLTNIVPYQSVLNLTGRSDNILDLSKGIAMNLRTKVGRTNSNGDIVEWDFSLMITFYCEEFKLATQAAQKLKKLRGLENLSAVVFFPVRIFFFILLALRQFKDTGKWSYRREAKKYYTLFRKWVVKLGAINLVHKLLILDAEMLSTERKVKSDMLKTAYDRAIAASSRTGFLQDAALAAHLASLSITDVEDRMEYQFRARNFYLKWGATGVVEYLEASSKFNTIPPAATTDTSSSILPRPGFRSRERFDKKVSDQHRKSVFRSIR